MKNENVLCTPINTLKKNFDLNRDYWVCNNNTIDLLSYEYIPRNEAEDDCTYKQIIPYALVFNSEGKLLYYRRCGSENRLSGLLSAGIGGHVNDKDGGTTLYGKIVSGLIREIKEELGQEINHNQLCLLGMINEDLTNVGHCHIGVVFKITSNEDQMIFENGLGNPLWGNTTELDLSCFELWSSLAIKLLHSYSLQIKTEYYE